MNDFDLQVRQMLADAEEKAPRRVWDAVSASIGGSRGFQWGWTAAALACACAAALIFLLPGTSVPEGSDAPAGVETALAEAKTQPILPAEAVTAAAAEEHAPAIEEPAEVIIVNSEAPEALPDAATAKKEPSASSSTEPFVDPFAEEILPRHKPAGVHLAGTVGGNRPGNGGASRMSPGTPGISDRDVYSEKSESSFGIPFTVGVGVRFYVSPKLSIGTGLDYSLLTRTYCAAYTPAGTTDLIDGDVRNTLHYIGIPLNIYYDIVTTNTVDFYVFGGAECQYCVSDKSIFHSGAIEKTFSSTATRPQVSVGAGLGVEFNVSKHLGIFLDPGVSYYFYTSQPRSIRTERPLTFNINAGIRFNFPAKVKE